MALAAAVPNLVGVALDLVTEYLIPWLFGAIIDRSPEGLAKALRVVRPIVEEMLESGDGRLSPSARAPFEVRMVLALRAAGLVEDRP